MSTKTHQKHKKGGITYAESKKRLDRQIKEYFKNDPGDTIDDHIEQCEDALRYAKIHYPEIFASEHRKLII